MFMLLGNRIHPAIRIAIGAVVLIVGVALHRVPVDVAGGAVMLVGAGQWLYKARRR